MPRRSILVTYTLYPSPTPLLNDALANIHAQLPLRNLHWKSSSRTAIRTIQEVEIELKELGEVTSTAREAAQSVLEDPLVNLCLVTCDVSESGLCTSCLSAGCGPG